MVVRSPRWWNPCAVKVERNYLGVSLYRGGFHGRPCRGPRTSNTRLSGGLMGPFRYRARPSTTIRRDRRRSIDRSIGPLIDRSIYESVARLNRFPLLPPFSPFCELQPFFYLATVDYFISTRCNDRVAAYRFLIRVNSRASNYSSSIDFLSFLAYVILFVHRYRVKFVVKIIEAWRIGRSARIRRNWFATRRIGHGRTQVFADGRIVEADLGSARLNPPPSPSFYPL